MRVPIQYALYLPERKKNNFPKLDFRKLETLNFFEPDKKRFPCLHIAYQAGKAGGTYPAVMSAANEIAVDMFIKGKVDFYGISDLIQQVLERHDPLYEYTLEELIEIDSWARSESAKIIRR